MICMWLWFKPEDGMKAISFKVRVVFTVFFVMIVLSGCETQSGQKTSKSKNSRFKGKERFLSISLDEAAELLYGSWEIIETNVMGSDLQSKTLYTFKRVGLKCRKQNIFEGYVEEIIGNYVVERKVNKNYLTIDFENGTKEEFDFYFEAKNTLRTNALVDEFMLKYILKRIEKNNQ